MEVIVVEIGFPCVVNPIMSSSGKAQSVVKPKNDIDSEWSYAQEGHHRIHSFVCLANLKLKVKEGGSLPCEGSTLENAREKANKAAASIHYTLD